VRTTFRALSRISMRTGVEGADLSQKLIPAPDGGFCPADMSSCTE
jgi:hypothetical protein